MAAPSGLLAELDPRLKRDLVWSAIVKAEVTVMAGDGKQLFTKVLDVPAAENSFALRVPEQGEIPDEDYAVRVRIYPEGDQSVALSDTARVALGRAPRGAQRTIGLAPGADDRATPRPDRQHALPPRGSVAVGIRHTARRHAPGTPGGPDGQPAAGARCRDNAGPIATTKACAGWWPRSRWPRWPRGSTRSSSSWREASLRVSRLVWCREWLQAPGSRLQASCHGAPTENVRPTASTDRRRTQRYRRGA